MEFLVLSHETMFRQRLEAVAVFFQDCTHLLFLDADVAFTVDTIRKMLGAGGREGHVKGIKAKLPSVRVQRVYKTCLASASCHSSHDSWTRPIHSESLI